MLLSENNTINNEFVLSITTSKLIIFQEQHKCFISYTKAVCQQFFFFFN